MKKSTLFLSSIALISLVIGLAGCSKKGNTINNSQVIETPYSLYFTDTAGALYNSNDGKNMKVVFPPDGAATLSLVTVNKNIILAKSGGGPGGANTLYVSTDNGKNFNYSYLPIDVATVPNVAVNGKPYNLNQTMLIVVPSWNHEYVASRTTTGLNYFGFSWNAQDGAFNQWSPENYYDTDKISNTGGIRITSFTLLKSGLLIAFDPITQKLLYRPDINTRWEATLLPVTPLPGPPSYFSIGHLNNRLIAIDNYGTAGAWYSDDIGVNWYAYSGLPANTPLNCVVSPFEQVCLVGTDGKGLYLLNPNTNSFQVNNNGLATNLIVRNIAFKENIFKNGTRQQYVYLATNQGIYQSSDMGVNWVRTIPGNFVNIY